MVSDEIDDFVAPAPVAGEASSGSIFDQLLSGDDDEHATEPSDADLGTLEDEFNTLRELWLRRKRLKDQLKELEKEYAAQLARMGSAMKGQGTSQFRGAEGQGMCYEAEEYSTTVEDESAFAAWASEEAPELFSINAQTRDSFIRKNYRDKGVPPDSPDFPPGLKVRERKVVRPKGLAGTTKK